MEELGSFWQSTLPSMVRVKELLKKSNSFEEFKVFLEKEFGSKIVPTYGLDLWKMKREEVIV